MAGRPRTVSDADILTATGRAISRVGAAPLTQADRWRDLPDLSGERRLRPSDVMVDDEDAAAGEPPPPPEANGRLAPPRDIPSWETG